MTTALMESNAHQPAVAALAAVLIVLSFAAAASAQEPAGNGTQTLPSSAASAVSAVPAGPLLQPTLADFAWLAGEWHGTWGPRLALEAWTPPHSGTMLGSFQLSENGKTLVIELVTLTEGDGGLEMHIRHFTPALVAWEKEDPVDLNLQSANPTTAVFENHTDGEPKTATFTRLGADSYVSRFELTSEKGDAHITQIVYHRQIASPPSKQPKHKQKRSGP
ncbi:MAG TPA: DUF6265 family protein [Candidatus Acidoferrales bacterium]